MDSAATEGRKELTGTAIQILWGKDLVSARTLQRHQSNIYSGLKIKAEQFVPRYRRRSTHIPSTAFGR